MGIPMHGNPPERPNSGPNWVKSSLSFSNGNCVEVASLTDGTIGVRNSRDPEGPVLRLRRTNGMLLSEACKTENSTVSADSGGTGMVL